jgi:hypothetical protein
MEIVKETEQYQIIKKRSGRYGVRKVDRSWVSGDEKVKILVTEGLLKVAAPKEAPAPEEPPADTAEEAPADAEKSE